MTFSDSHRVHDQRRAKKKWYERKHRTVQYREMSISMEIRKGKHSNTLLLPKASHPKGHCPEREKQPRSFLQGAGQALPVQLGVPFLP